MTTDKISRRTLGGLAAAGVGVPLLAACGSDDPEVANDPAPTGSTGSTSPSAASSGGAPTGDALTSTGDIEVGGGAIFADAEVVVTQPSEGEFKCFTAICSHQGCLVNSVSDGTINCDCHGSRFSIESGEPESGSQATSPLGEVQLSVTGDQISLA